MSRSLSSPLVIAGMHRSGTSLLASLAAQAGVDMGAELLAGSKGNRHGHFEDPRLVRFHEECLGRREAGPFRPPEGGIAAFFPGEEQEAEAILRERQGKTAWGFKDPR
ncbi:MAG TPA: family 2 glycosyl transferase, partial [Thermoanaerobaculia bacterium]|nr:family 2 glycosyl transferase [Thermoanaerobaculia bacterium]